LPTARDPARSSKPRPRPPRIPERTLMAATDALGVRTQRGQWWLPG
jgi:hypothetical protein